MAKRRLLSSDDCGFCDVIKDELKDKIERGEIEVINVDNDKDARDLARLFGGVPTLIEEDNGEIYELVLVEDSAKIKKKPNIEDYFNLD